jgi:hypothetical protein
LLRFAAICRFVDGIVAVVMFFAHKEFVLLEIIRMC